MHSSEYLLSTCCVPGGTQFNAGVIERKIKAHTLPSRSSQSNVTERCGNEEWNSVWEVLITKTCSKGGQPGIHSTTVSTVKVCGVPPPLRNKCLTWLSSVFQCQCDNGDPHYYDKLQGMVIRFPLLGTWGKQFVVAEVLTHISYVSKIQPQHYEEEWINCIPPPLLSPLSGAYALFDTFNGIKWIRDVSFSFGVRLYINLRQ